LEKRILSLATKFGLSNRRFLLNFMEAAIFLADLAPDLVIPGRGVVRELLAGVGRQGVEQLEKSEG
jgi:hypothetical protein